MNPNAILALTLLEAGLRIASTLSEDELPPEKLAEIKKRADVSDDKFDALVKNIRGEQA